MINMILVTSSVRIHPSQQRANVTFNFRFICMIKKSKVRRHTLIKPLPLSQTVTRSQTPPPSFSSLSYFMDGPLLRES